MELPRVHACTPPSLALTMFQEQLDARHPLVVKPIVGDMMTEQINSVAVGFKVAARTQVVYRRITSASTTQ